MAPSFLHLRVSAAAFLVVVALSACGDTFRAPAAVVNGAEITDDQIRADVPLYEFLVSLRQVACGQPTPGESIHKACVRFVLSNLVQQEIAVAYAGHHDIDVSGRRIDETIRSLESQLGGHDALLRLLRRHDTTFAEFRRLVDRLILVQDVVRAVAAETIPQAELKRLYRQEKARFTSLHAAHILVDSKKEAERIAREATAANFASLARRFSTDPGSAPRGGDLGTLDASRLDPTFVRAALSLEPGKISKPVHTQFGWHVILLKSVQVTPFSAVETRLIEQEAGDAYTAWLRARLGGGDISINPRYGRLDTSTGQILPLRTTASTPSP